MEGYIENVLNVYNHIVLKDNYKDNLVNKKWENTACSHAEETLLYYVKNKNQSKVNMRLI